MRVRIGTRAIYGHGDDAGKVVAGADVLWVELDGHRFDQVIDAQFNLARNELSGIELVLHPIGTVEVVYVGREGEEVGLGGSAPLGETLAYRSTFPGPAADA